MGNKSNSTRTTVMAMCYLIVEYAVPVWARSTYPDIFEPELTKACRAITGCLKLTYVEDVYLFVGIVPPDIRKDVCPRMERTRQMEQETSSMFRHIPARNRLKSRKDFLTSVKYPTSLQKSYDVTSCREGEGTSCDWAWST